MQDGYNGIGFITENDYINKIIEIIDDRRKLKTLEDNSKVSAIKYNSENYAREVLKVYKKVYKN